MWTGQPQCALAPSVPIFNKKSHQARTEECFKQKFPLLTTIKVEIFVWDIPQLALVSDEIPILLKIGTLKAKSIIKNISVLQVWEWCLHIFQIISIFWLMNETYAWIMNIFINFENQATSVVKISLNLGVRKIRAFNIRWLGYTKILVVM